MYSNHQNTRGDQKMKWIKNVRNQLDKTRTQTKRNTTKAKVIKTLITGDRLLQDTETNKKYLLTENDIEVYNNDLLKVKLTEQENEISQEKYSVVKPIEVLEENHKKTGILQDLTTLLDIEEKHLVISQKTGKPLALKENALKQVHNKVRALLNTIYKNEYKGEDQ